MEVGGSGRPSRPHRSHVPGESQPQEARQASCSTTTGTSNTLTYAAAGGALGGVAADSSRSSIVCWLGAPLPEDSRACCDVAASPATPEGPAASNCCSICATAHRQSSLFSWLRVAIPPKACGECGGFRLAFCIDLSPIRREFPPAECEEHAEADGLGDRCMVSVDLSGSAQKRHRIVYGLGRHTYIWEVESQPNVLLEPLLDSSSPAILHGDNAAHRKGDAARPRRLRRQRRNWQRRWRRRRRWRWRRQQ